MLAASLTRDPVLVAGVVFAQRLPWLLFSLLSGALADRLDRRVAMAATDAFRCVVIGLLGLAVMRDAASIPLMYAVFFVLGTAETLFDNAAVSVLPTVVPKTELDRANGRLFGARVVANELAGPPLAGLLFAAAGAVPFLLNAGTFAAASALVLAMRGGFRARREGPATTLRAEISEGVRWLWGHRLLRTLALSLGVMNLTLSAVLGIMVLFAQERLGLGPVGYGMLMASVAVGGVAGSVAAGPWISWLGQGTTMRVGLLIEASVHVAIVLAQNAYVVGAALVVFGFHGVIWSVVSLSFRQRIVPERLLGRVNSGYMLFAAGSVALGSLLGGFLARTFGLAAPFWFAFSLVVALILVVWPILNNRALAEAREGGASGVAP